MDPFLNCVYKYRESVEYRLTTRWKKKAGGGGGPNNSKPFIHALLQHLSICPMFFLILKPSFIGFCVPGVEVTADLLVALSHVCHVDTNIAIGAIGDFFIWIWIRLTTCENLA